MNNSWDTAERILFEHGVALYRDETSDWRCESAVGLYSTSPSDITRQFGLRPITAKFHTGSGLSYSSVFPSRVGKALNSQLSEQQQQVYRMKSSPFFLATQSLFYLLYAGIYHCERLAEQYADSIEQIIKLPNPNNADLLATYCYEGFFEFDALVTAVIRAIDATRYVLWRKYGLKGSVPSSFRRTIDNCTQLPDTLKQLAENLWAERLSHAKGYRDCIQHYVSVGSSSWAMVSRKSDLIWTMLLRIPDNPEVKSAKKFTFGRNFDAMTYGWELITDLFVLTGSIVQSVSADESNAGK